jgi:hypothetical protein
MSEAPELPPCPFCGGEASATNYIVEGAVRCSDCRASVSRTHGQYDEAGYEEAIAAWDTRADLSGWNAAIEAAAAWVETVPDVLPNRQEIAAAFRAMKET